jgi:ParB-like chromosome segregation protein Spo0J
MKAKPSKKAAVHPRSAKTLAQVFAAEAADCDAANAGLHSSPGADGLQGVDGDDTLLHLGDLVPDAQNPRKHNPKNIGMISDSLRDVGAGRSIVIDEHNEILAGNGLVEAAAEAGITNVRVVEADGNTIVAVRRTNLSPEQKRRLAIYDNRTAELAEWDIDVLRDFAADGLDLQPFEFSGEVIADIRNELPPPPAISAVRDTVPLASLKPHPKNYREHDEAQLAHLRQSIRDYGLYRTVVIAREDTILAGHGVVQAALQLGIKYIPVIKLDLDPLEARALKVLVGDNEIGHRADIDDRALTEMLKEIKGDDATLLQGTGFDAQSLAALAFVTRPASEIADIDAAAHWAGMPEYEVSPGKEQLILNFPTTEDRDRFVAEYGIVIMFRQKRTWTARWPHEPRENLVDQRLTADADVAAGASE